MAALLPPNKFVVAVFVPTNTDGEPKPEDGDTAPPKSDVVLGVLLAALPPKIFCTGFAVGVVATLTDPNILPVEAGLPVDGGDDAGVVNPKLANDNDDASDVLVPNTFDVGCD